MITIHHVRSILEQCEMPQEVLRLNDPDGELRPDQFESLVDTLHVIGFVDATVFETRAVGHSWEPSAPLMYKTTDAGHEWLSVNSKDATDEC